MGAHHALHHEGAGHKEGDGVHRGHIEWRSHGRRWPRARTYAYFLILVAALFFYWTLLRACQPITYTFGGGPA